MPNLDQAKKALRQTVTKRVLNDSRRRAVKESVKTVRKTAKTAPVAIDAPEMKTAFSALDKAAKRGVLKKKTASRLKSRLSKAGKKA